MLYGMLSVGHVLQQQLRRPLLRDALGKRSLRRRPAHRTMMV